MSFDACGMRRETSWQAMAGSLGLNTLVTTRGFTNHEMIDPVGLVHMNGRVYDPELGRFLSADPFIQDASNSQSLNRYTYVLNNPLSMTDPTGFFFGSVAKAIGNVIGGAFKAVASALKAALKVPLIRAVIQISACGTQIIAVCVGVTGLMELAAGGGIEGALKAMAFTAASYGIWGGVGTVLEPLEQAFSVANTLVTSAVHGAVNGALSLAQGGSFADGFVSGAIGQAMGMMTTSDGGPFTSIGEGGPLVRSVLSGAAGGAASALTGGKFANGFVTAAFAHMWNQEAHMIGQEGLRAFDASVVESGGRIIGKEVRYVVIDEDGNTVYRNGRPVGGRLDRVIVNDRLVLENWECKNGSCAKFLSNQTNNYYALQSGQIKYVGSEAQLRGIAGMTPSQAANHLGAMKYGGYRFANGPTGSPRAMRQWFRTVFSMTGRGGSGGGGGAGGGGH
jgi:RHS repeat-associated protein